MKCVVFGASGLSGGYVCSALGEKHEIVEVSSGSGSGVMLDASDFARVKKLLSKEKPDLVVNCVKKGSTDEAERERALAWKANVIVPQNLALLQGKLGFKLVHLSSDWVYEGREGETYSETSIPYPQNFYSFTKAVAEEIVKSLCEDYLIIRPESIFGLGSRGTDIFSRVMKASSGGKPAMLAKDQFSQPIYAKTLASFVSRAFEKNAAGTYNVAGPDYVSRYGLGVMFCDEFGWNRSSVEPYAGNRDIRIPKTLRLDIGKANAVMKIPTLREQVRELKQEVLGWKEESGRKVRE